MTASKNLRALMLARDVNQSAIARIAGVSNGAVSHWMSGAKNPGGKALERLCEHFGVTPTDLLSDEHGLASRPISPARISVRPMRSATVPVLGRVHAGKPEEPTETIYEAEIPASLLDADPDCYALISEGDCMNLMYPEGCVIVVSPNSAPRNGSVAVVRVDGRECVMRRLYRTASTLVLSPESSNPEHRDIVITRDDGRTVEFVGRVVWFQAREALP